MINKYLISSYKFMSSYLLTALTAQINKFLYLYFAFEIKKK